MSSPMSLHPEMRLCPACDDLILELYYPNFILRKFIPELYLHPLSRFI